MLKQQKPNGLLLLGQSCHQKVGAILGSPSEWLSGIGANFTHRIVGIRALSPEQPKPVECLQQFASLLVAVVFAHIRWRHKDLPAAGINHSLAWVDSRKTSPSNVIWNGSEMGLSMAN
jgi:hypothetical protein